MTTTISQQTIDIVKSTAPVLKQHGQAITTRMYEIMFDRYPEIKTQFDMSAQAMVLNQQNLLLRCMPMLPILTISML